MKYGKDLKEYIKNNMYDIAENHIDCWKDRYYRESLNKIRYDLSVNHDDSLEIEEAEETLKRKLSDDEIYYLCDKFHKAVIKQIRN